MLNMNVFVDAFIFSYILIIGSLKYNIYIYIFNFSSIFDSIILDHL